MISNRWTAILRRPNDEDSRTSVYALMLTVLTCALVMGAALARTAAA